MYICALSTHNLQQILKLRYSFQSITLYGVASIVERITSKSSIKSKLYTIIIATIYTAVDGKLESL